MKASVIIVNYNYQEYLSAAIDSVLSQTNPPTEIIVVDDGSTDQSRDIIASYGRRLTPICKPNAGQASAFNAGFQASCGDVVVFLDADDLLYPRALGNIRTIFSEDPEAVRVQWKMDIVDRHGDRENDESPWVKEQAKRLPLDEGDLSRLVLEGGPYMYKWSPTSGNAWARRFLLQALPVPEAPFWNTAEIYLSALCPLFGTIRLAGDTLSAWRNHSDNFTAMQRTDEFERELTWGLERFESCLQATEKFARQLGFRFNPQVWKSNSWFHRMSSAVNEIVDHVPSGETIILADHDAWNVGTYVRGRRCLPYMNTTPGVWEQPNAGKLMVDEIERLRAEGAGFFCVTWLAFWLLEWPPVLRTYLDKRTDCLKHTRDIAIYKLAPLQPLMRGPDISEPQPSSR